MFAKFLNCTTYVFLLQYGYYLSNKNCECMAYNFNLSDWNFPKIWPPIIRVENDAGNNMSL
jgi:hypothetical protein